MEQNRRLAGDTRRHATDLKKFDESLVVDFVSPNRGLGDCVSSGRAAPLRRTKSRALFRRLNFGVLATILPISTHLILVKG